VPISFFDMGTVQKKIPLKIDNLDNIRGFGMENAIN
jgi:hypothetical protein